MTVRQCLKFWKELRKWIVLGRSTFTTIFRRKPHPIFRIIMQIKSMMQSKSILSKFRFKILKSLIFVNVRISPSTIHIMFPPIVRINFLFGPSFGILSIGETEMQYKSSASIGIGYLTEFASVEYLHIVCLAILCVVLKLKHSLFGGVVNEWLIGIILNGFEVGSKIFGENELKHHSSTEIECGFCIVKIDEVFGNICAVCFVSLTGFH
mmetsp:Transcript_18488/g.26029  ORF Transcript_18488/g.26029 Transcript_18488/m.26029 type:complete len:209 (+) Transcript_18488:348-974(+)